MKKLLFLAFALFAVCGMAYADLLIDMEITTAANGTTVDPQSGGAGNHAITLSQNYTGPLYVWVYGEVTPHDGNTEGYDDGTLGGVRGNITEASAGVHGDMSFGTVSTGTPTATKTLNQKLYVYNTGIFTDVLNVHTPPGNTGVVATPNYNGGAVPTLTTNAYGDQDMGHAINMFAPTDVTQSPESFNTWVTLGHYTYTVKSGSAGSSTITFTPQQTFGGAGYQLGWSNGDGTGDTSGYDNYTGLNNFSGSSLTITIVPEPSTLVLLVMGRVGLRGLSPPQVRLTITRFNIDS